MPSDEPLQAARTRARRRLMGAAVLLAVGVIGFPILFETKPRPLPVDLPMLLPEGEGRKVAAASAPAALPRLPADAGVESGPAATAAATPTGAAAPAVSPVAAASSVAATGPVAAPKPVASASAPPALTPAPVAVASAAIKTAAPAPRVAEAVAAPAAPAGPVAATKPAPAPAESVLAGSGRFVVQVGAYNDAERLRSARQKLEKMGLKSYTQDVETSTGKRTRVRLGPYPTRKEADAVAAKVKASGMQANILAL